MPNISEKELDHLLSRAAELDALEAGGVDNWEFYSDSLASLRREREMAEDFEDSLNEMLLTCEVDYPAGMEAGPSISVPSEGKRILQGYIKKYYVLRNLD